MTMLQAAAPGIENNQLCHEKRDTGKGSRFMTKLSNYLLNFSYRISFSTP
jgi:hypothetical protein